MPELPDISAYIKALEGRIVGRTLEKVRVTSPFLLRTVDPPLESAEGRRVTAIRRIGKRIAIGLDTRGQQGPVVGYAEPRSGQREEPRNFLNNLDGPGRSVPQGLKPMSSLAICGTTEVVPFQNTVWLVIHLMIAGRLHWKAKGAKVGGRQNLAAFDFSTGTLTLTEAGSKRRASLHVIRGEAGLDGIDPGGVEVFETDLAGFRAALGAENRTLKRALTDPRMISGVGNAYSDEILWAAGLSPVTLTSRLTDGDWERLFAATRETLTAWMERLGKEAEAGFPEGVTAFRPEMAVHGRFGKACPRCGSAVQRIRYADNETNYCATCQTGGKVLADRSLSRLLGADWPRTLDELEALKRR
jgi:formamidopyrimidine-DNA glycosylase